MSVPRILVVGSGGREHALAWRLARDPGSPEVLVAPGNDGIGRDFRRLEIAENDADGLLAACRRERVELVVVGPEAPLASGLIETLEAGGVPAFGPGREAARLESSTGFAKDVLRDAGNPTAEAETLDDPRAALAALARRGPPWVIKADGLASGKGVCVTESRAEAEAFALDCLERGRFGESGRRVLIEEFLEGEEASLLAVCDGARHRLLPAARDFKRAFDGDRGPNTGGMGAHAPHPDVDAALEREVSDRIVAPLLGAMAARGVPFRGLLYCGLMLGAEGPGVVEFNCRFGDPEAQVVLPLIAGDLSGLLESAARGALEPDRIGVAAGAAVAVALTHRDYPGPPDGEGVIENLDALEGQENVTVFCSAARREGSAWRVPGGRAATVMARAADREHARRRAYDAIDRLGGSGWRCRRDIAAGAGATPRVTRTAGAGRA